MTDLSQSGHDLHRGTERSADVVRAAVRLTVGIGAAALIFLVLANVWMGTCTGSTADGLACGTTSRSVLTAGAPLLLLLGAVVAARRGQRAHDSDGEASPWMIASLTLAVLTLFVAALSWSSLAG
jgi:hypothetical protein